MNGVHSYTYDNLKNSLLAFGLFCYAALGWLIKNKKPQKSVWTCNPNRGHPFWEEFWPQGFDHEQPFQLSYSYRCEVGPFRWDKCCHLLCSYDIAVCKHSKLQRWWSLLWPHLSEAFWWLRSLTSAVAGHKSVPHSVRVTGNSYSEKAEKSCWLLSMGRMTYTLSNSQISFDQVAVPLVPSERNSSSQVLKQCRFNYFCNIISKGWTFWQLLKNQFNYLLKVVFF